VADSVHGRFGFVAIHAGLVTIALTWRLVDHGDGVSPVQGEPKTMTSRVVQPEAFVREVSWLQ
jgi:hypothetical protein